MRWRCAQEACAERGEDVDDYLAASYKLDGRTLVYFGAATAHLSLMPAAFVTKIVKANMARIWSRASARTRVRSSDG